MPFRTIRSKLLFTYIFLILGSLALTGFLFLQGMRASLVAKVKASLRRDGNVVLKWIEVKLSAASDLEEAATSYLVAFRRESGVHLRVFDITGRLLCDSQPGGRQPFPAQYEEFLHSTVAEGESLRVFDEGGARVMHVAMPVKRLGQAIGVLDVANPLTDVESSLAHMRQILFFSIWLATACAVLVSALISGHIIRPVHLIRNIAQRIAGGELSERVSYSSRDELGQLGRTINHMAGEIQKHVNDLEREKNKMNVLLASLIEGVIAVDMKGNVIFLNATAEKMLRQKSAEAYGRPLKEIWPNEEVLAFFSEGMKQEAVIQKEAQIPNNVLVLTMIPCADEQRAHQGFMLVFRDITEIRRLEEARTQFISNVSHELRTPLTIIKGFVITLLDDCSQDQPELQRYLFMIDRETDRLARLVDDLLELSRFRNKTISFNIRPVAALPIIKQTLSQMVNQAEKLKIRLKSRLSSGEPVVLADEDRFRQVLINLLDNGLKYTPENGEVALETRVENGDLVIEVSDTGEGIPREELPYVFERYFRGSEKKRKQVTGTGLGLPIVKEIIEAHHGSIQVQSREGFGTTITFTLPLAQM